MSNDFRSSSDGKLLSLIQEAQGGNQSAFEELLNRYEPLIDAVTGSFCRSSAPMRDYEDMRQEAVIGFYHALMKFDANQNEVPFGVYAKICIRNRLISYLRVVKQHENVILLEDDAVLAEAEDAKNDPAEQVVEEENYLALSRRIHDTLSAYENRIWWLYLSGRTAKEIALMLGKDEKSVQNAVYRIRQKLRAVIPYS